MALIVEKLVGVDLRANALNIIRVIREFGRGGKTGARWH